MGVLSLIIIRRFKGKRPKILEVGTLFYFFLLALAAIFFDLEKLGHGVNALSSFILMAIVFISIIIKKPFSIQYAKEVSRPEVWNNPEFIRVNYVISWAWFIAFLVNLILPLSRCLGVRSPKRLDFIVSLICIISVIKFSRWYAARVKAGITVLFLLVFIPCAFAAVPKSDLSLGDAISIAYSNNKDIQIQEREVAVSKANILEANSKFLPTINLNGSYTHNDKVLAQNIFSGFYDDNVLELVLNQSVYNGGANIANYKQAKLGLTVQEETLKAKKLDIEFEAKRLYFGLLLAYETERIAIQALNQAKAHYEDTVHLFDQGTVSRFDVLQSKVQVSLLEPQVVKARNDIDSLKADLNKLLGQDVNTPIEIKEKLKFSSIEVKETDFLKTAYLERPEIKLKALGIDINRWSIQMARAGYRPQVDVQAGYSYRSNNISNMVNGAHRNWNTGVAITLPIFEGFSTKAKVEAARERYAQAKIDKENLVQQIAVDIRKSCFNLKDSQEIINSQKDNVSEAEEALRISEVSFKNGVATNLDVLDAQVSLAQIENNLAQAIYDYLMAQASLDRGMGKFYGGNNEKKG